jgi:hypothetical protein
MPMTLLTKRFYLIMLAGLAGGVSEIFWIGIYSAVTHVSGLEISRQITATIIPAWTNLSIAPMLGVVFHLALSIVLAYCCYQVLIEPVCRRFGLVVIMPGSVVVLAGVWLINFLVLLPVINPAFTTLLPFLVTLASKMLFGLVMGAVLTHGFVDTANHSVH